MYIKKLQINTHKHTVMYAPVEILNVLKMAQIINQEVWGGIYGVELPLILAL